MERHWLLLLAIAIAVVATHAESDEEGYLPLPPRVFPRARCNDHTLTCLANADCCSGMCTNGFCVQMRFKRETFLVESPEDSRESGPLVNLGNMEVTVDLREATENILAHTQEDTQEKKDMVKDERYNPVIPNPDDPIYLQVGENEYSIAQSIDGSLIPSIDIENNIINEFIDTEQPNSEWTTITTTFPPVSTTASADHPMDSTLNTIISSTAVNTESGKASTGTNKGALYSTTAIPKTKPWTSRKPTMSTTMPSTGIRDFQTNDIITSTPQITSTVVGTGSWMASTGGTRVLSSSPSWLSWLWDSTTLVPTSQRAEYITITDSPKSTLSSDLEEASSTHNSGEESVENHSEYPVTTPTTVGTTITTRPPRKMRPRPPYSGRVPIRRPGNLRPSPSRRPPLRVIRPQVGQQDQRQNVPISPLRPVNSGFKNRRPVFRPSRIPATATMVPINRARPATGFGAIQSSSGFNRPSRPSFIRNFRTTTPPNVFDILE